MRLQLPDFTDRRCLQLDLCGFVIAEESRGIRPPKVLKKALKTEARVAGKSTYIGIILPFPLAKKFHVHLKVASAEYFGDEPPELNSTPEEIFALLDPFAGKTLNVKVGGTFSVQQNQLPPFIRSTLAGSQADGVQVRLVGGTLEVTGAPIHRITWKLEKGGRAQVDVQASTTLKLSKNYLIEALEYIETAFSAFVAAEEENESS